MNKAKVVSYPLTTHFKLSTMQSPSTDKKKEDMKKVLYALAVGSLMYAIVSIRLSATHAVGVVNRFLSNPGREHWNAAKQILRYLRGTSKLGLSFESDKPMLAGYTNADMVGEVNLRKFTLGYLITFSSKAVSLQSRSQKCTAFKQ